MCHSEYNRLSAHLFAKRAHDVLTDLEAWGLCRLRESLAQTRAECIQRCVYVADIIYPCLAPSGNNAPRPFPLEKPLPVKDLTTSRATCAVALKRVLYAPCLSAHAMTIARLLCDSLHAAGHAEAARVVWLYTAGSAGPPVAAPTLPAKRAQCSPSSSS
jgi:hypothetical protein